MLTHDGAEVDCYTTEDCLLWYYFQQGDAVHCTAIPATALCKPLNVYIIDFCTSFLQIYDDVASYNIYTTFST